MPVKRNPTVMKAEKKTDGSKPQQKRRSAGKAIRPDNDDPSGMLGPLVPDDPEDDDDDTPGGM